MSWPVGARARGRLIRVFTGALIETGIGRRRSPQPHCPILTLPFNGVAKPQRYH